MELRNKAALITALSLTVSLFAGCGALDGDGMERTDVSVTESTTEITEDVEETEQTEAAVTESTEVSETTAVTTTVSEKTANKEAADYEDLIRSYYEAENNSDYEAFMNLMYPEKIVDYMYTISGITAESMAESLGTSDSHYEVTEIINEGEITDEYLDSFTMTFNAMYGIYCKLESEGRTVEDLTDEERAEFSGIVYGDVPEAYASDKYKATKGYDVTVRYTIDGKPDEDYFYVFYIDGEGWKLTNTMRKWLKNAQQSSLNANAKSLFTSVTTALMELTSGNENLYETYVLSSDPSKNYNIPSGLDTDELYNKIDEYLKLYDEDNTYDYVALIVEGVCKYTAMHKNSEGYGVGTFPQQTIPEKSGTSISSKEVDRMGDYTLDDIYGICVDLIK
ncbi:MAG: hypothetical protein IKM72_04655 [Oscillospiraceae bacterium]|nr:hypothetical protein [Oscillospiraceae bacterium]